MAVQKVPMASVQMEMWHAEQATTSARENVYCAFRLHGHLDVDALSRALAAVVARHEPLRTSMVFDQEPVQLISDSFSVGIEPIEVASQAEAVDLIQADAGTRLPLDTLPLWHISLARLPDGDHVLGLVFHHIIVDGWSLYVFLADLGDAYGRAVSGHDPSLAPLSYTYSDYCREDRRLSGTAEFKNILAHWRKLLPADPPELRLPRDGGRMEGAEARGDAFDTSLDSSATAYMNQRARASRCTVFTLIFDAVAVTLAEHGDTDQVTVGVPFHNRTKRQQRPLVGFIANMLPMAMTGISSRSTDRDRLDYARSVSTAALRYPGVPPEVLMRELYGLTDPEPLTFCLNVQSPPGISYGLAGIDMTEIPLHNGTIFHDFELTLVKTSDHVVGDFTYDADLYSRSRADAVWADTESRLLRPVL
jgi:hypothetical protein